MYPRLYMESFQYAAFDSKTERVIFKTRHASGRHFHFTLSKEQFLAFDDAIAVIERSHCYGDYPLGQNTWLNYNESGVSLYKNVRDSGRIKFYFSNFREYKRYTHSRLKSFVPLTRKESGRLRHYGNTYAASHKRPSSITMRQSDKSRATKRKCRRGRCITSRKTKDAELSSNEETCSVLSEWDYSNSRCSDSISSESSDLTNITTPSSIRLLSSNDTVESE